MIWLDLGSYWRLWEHTYIHTYIRTFFLNLEILSDLIINHGGVCRTALTTASLLIIQSKDQVCDLEVPLPQLLIPTIPTMKAIGLQDRNVI